MATQDGAGRAGAEAVPTVGLALSGSTSSANVLRWALAKFANNPAAPAAAAFRLIHVLTPVLAVPTQRMLFYTLDSRLLALLHPRFPSPCSSTPSIPVSLLFLLQSCFAAVLCLPRVC
jgi:hypothetical protein